MAMITLQKLESLDTIVRKLSLKNSVLELFNVNFKVEGMGESQDGTHIRQIPVTPHEVAFKEVPTIVDSNGKPVEKRKGEEDNANWSILEYSEGFGSDVELRDSSTRSSPARIMSTTDKEFFTTEMTESSFKLEEFSGKKMEGSFSPQSTEVRYIDQKGKQYDSDIVLTSEFQHLSSSGTNSKEKEGYPDSEPFYCISSEK